MSERIVAALAGAAGGAATAAVLWWWTAPRRPRAAGPFSATLPNRPGRRQSPADDELISSDGSQPVSNGRANANRVTSMPVTITGWRRPEPEIRVLPVPVDPRTGQPTRSPFLRW